VEDQVIAAHQLLKEPEKDLNDPSLRIDQCDHFGRHVKQIGGNAKYAVAAPSGRSPFVLTAASVGTAANADQPNHVIGAYS